MNERDILTLIQKDMWMMDVLTTARSMNLPDWMIGAGFVRGKVWDYLHGYTERTPLADIDLIYFDSADISEETEKKYELQLSEILSVPWSVKNQARMHIVNSEAPYTSSEDALAHWVETPTCVAVYLDEHKKLHLVAPHGIEDLVHLRVTPSPAYTRSLDLYRERITKKAWKQKWPKLQIEEP